MPKEHKQPKREDVLNSVRAYVSEIECFARRGWEGRVKDVWETIFKGAKIIFKNTAAIICNI